MDLAREPAASCVRAVQSALRRFGIQLVRYDPQRDPHQRRAALLRSLQIDIILDVGANEGHWAEAVRRAGYTGRIVSFEPLISARCELERRAASDPEWDVCPFALGKRAETAAFHVAANSSSSSLLPMTERLLTNAPEVGYVGDERVEIRRLDDAAAELVQDDSRAWLKLDVQGYELPVIEGAERTLKQAEAVEIELSFVALYEGQALIGDMLSYLNDHGFGARSFEPVVLDRTSSELLQVDGIFVRRGERRPVRA